MSVGGRGQTRQRMLRRAGLVAGALVVVALLFLISGHWVLGIMFGVAAVVALWAFRQLRSVH